MATCISEQGDPQGFVRFTGERLEPDFQANVRYSQLSPTKAISTTNTCIKVIKVLISF